MGITTTTGVFAGSTATAGDIDPGALQKSANLSDIASSTTARTNLGLGTAATHPSTDFDAAGAAAAIPHAIAEQDDANLSSIGDRQLFVWDLNSEKYVPVSTSVDTDGVVSMAGAVLTGSIRLASIQLIAGPSITVDAFNNVFFNVTGHSGLVANNTAQSDVYLQLISTSAHWAFRTDAGGTSDSGLVLYDFTADEEVITFAPGNDALFAHGVQATGGFTGDLTGTASGNVPLVRLIGTTAPLSGGGDLSGDLALSLDPTGVSLTSASNTLTAQSGAVASVATFTPGADGTYRVGAWAAITAVAVDVLNVQVTYTDQTNTSRTMTFFPQGLTSASLAATGAYGFPTIDIRAKSGTAIIVKTILAIVGGSITYDVGATIQQLS